jgi:predicted RNA-binding protein with PUA-like domain
MIRPGRAPDPAGGGRFLTREIRRPPAVDSPRSLKQNDATMPIQHWLLKTEPSEYSFEDLVASGRESWDGITNPLALKHLRSFRAGDLALIYHTGGVRCAVGIARILGAPYPDPKAGSPARVAVDLEPVRRLREPVSLEAMKGHPGLKGLELFRITRLSVVPLGKQHWNIILKMSGSPS